MLMKIQSVLLGFGRRMKQMVVIIGAGYIGIPRSLRSFETARNERSP